MMSSWSRIHRWLMVPIPLFMAACCLKNPAVYFSTGTTVGLEATPPANETPPSITFGYKRAEIAMVPVTKLDEKPAEPADATPGSPPSQPKTGSLPAPTTDVKPSGPIQQKSGSPPFDRGCSELPPSAYSGSSIARDAYSVLAVFHLAVNWFGPAKIEQHFATGCAATHLIRGLTEEEEDKRKAEEAGNEAQEAKRLLKITKSGADKLLQQAQALEETIQKTKEDAEKASAIIDDQTSNDETKKEAKKKLLQAGKEATERQATAVRLQSNADNINRLEEAKTKAQGAAEKADKATRTEEVRPKAQKTKDDATQLVTDIKAMEQQVSTNMNDTCRALDKVLELGDEIRAKVPDKVTP